MHPTHRISKGRAGMRQAHQALNPPVPGTCPISEMPKQHHRACKESGYVRPGLTIRVPKLGIGTSQD